MARYRPEDYFKGFSIAKRVTFFTALVIIPIICLIISIISVFIDLPIWIEVIKYYSFIVLLLLSLMSLADLSGDYLLLGGIYSTVGLILIWFVPFFNPFFLITHFVTTGKLTIEYF